jgi:hypothetical protein
MPCSSLRVAFECQLCPTSARKRSEAILHQKRLAALALLDEKVKQVEEMGGTVAGSYYRE